MVLKAVAENQPQCPVAHAVEHQNRMSFYRPFEPLVTRLREFIRTSGAKVGHETAPGGGSPDHFETLARENIEALSACTFKRIVTTDPRASSDPSRT